MDVSANRSDLMHMFNVWERLLLIDAGCTNRPALAFLSCLGHFFSRRSMPFLTMDGMVKRGEVMLSVE